LRGRNDIGVGTILAKDLKEREVQAAVIAKRLRATIVIYGIVRDKGAILAFEPRFYVSPEFAAAQPELSGADSLGKPVELLKGWYESGDLTVRINILKSFLDGMAKFITGKYPDAQVAFEKAI
jgi:hypothetical protein